MFTFMLMDSGINIKLFWIFRLSITSVDWEYGKCTNLTVGIWKPEVTLSLGWRTKEPSLKDIDTNGAEA